MCNLGLPITRARAGTAVAAVDGASRGAGGALAMPSTAKKRDPISGELGGGGALDQKPPKRMRFAWSDQLHQTFMVAIFECASRARSPCRGAAACCRPPTHSRTHARTARPF